MTTTTTVHPPALPLTTTRPPLSRRSLDDVAAVPAATNSEWIKLRSLRSTPVFLVLAVVVGVLLSWILATFVKSDPDTHEVFTIAQTFIFSTWLTTVMTVIMGTLLFTSEVQHGTLATVVAAQPARWVTVVAKAAAASCFGLIMGVAGMVAGLGGAGNGPAATASRSPLAAESLKRSSTSTRRQAGADLCRAPPRAINQRAAARPDPAIKDGLGRGSSRVIRTGQRRRRGSQRHHRNG